MYVCDMSMQLPLKHSYPACIKCITLMFAVNIINQTSVNVKVYYEVTECSLRGGTCSPLAPIPSDQWDWSAHVGLYREWA